MTKNHKHYILAFLRIGFGMLILAALVAQIIRSIEQGSSISNFFSFFTIESNLLAAVILLVVGIGALVGKKARPQFAFIRGAMTLYMVITGIVFALLLSGLEQRLQTTIPWTNMVFHQLMPVVVLLDWVLFPPKFAFKLRHAIWWLAFPLAYLLYTLIRGSLTGWYPYPFLDVSQTGWLYVITVCVGIAIGATVLAWLLALRTQHRLAR